MRLGEREALTPEMARELTALDAALAGEPVDDDLGALGELAVALRDDRLAPTTGFAERLDRKVEKGFPSETPTKQRLARIRVAPLALGGAASIFIALAALLSSGVLSGGGGNDRGAPRPVPVSVPQTAAQERQAGSAAQGSGPAVTAAPALPPASAAPLSKRAAGRKVERAASIALAAPPRDIEDVADGAIRVTDRYGGYVMSSSVSSGEHQTAGATLDLRIPASQLQPAIADLSRLAHVRSRTQSSSDITAQFGGPRRRLANALSERKALLRQLARAATPNETASIKARLRLADRRIDRARRALRRLDARVGLAAVGVTVEASAGDQGSGTWTPGDALRDALSVLGAVVGGLIIALAVAVPLALAAIAVLAARRSFLRHARERALDA
jgi:hypothetical protein